MRWTFAAWVLAGTAMAQQVAGPLPKGGANEDDAERPRHSSISFSYVPTSADQATWQMEVQHDGSGIYRLLDGVSAPVPIHVGWKTVAELEGGSDAVEQHRCETHAHNIARSGVKTIRYVVGEVPISCEFNYSDDAALNEASNAFLAMAQTIEMGRELARLRRFDRLGLDAEMDELMAEVKDDRAREVQNIAPVLQSLVEDERVMERVRRKASQLLVQAGVAVAPVK